MRIIGTITAVAAAILFVTPVASADAGACVSYLTDLGEDNTVRVQLCAETETLGDAVSQQYAYTVCTTGMTVSGLSRGTAAEACEFAIAP